jgi:hypothetical protein
MRIILDIHVMLNAELTLSSGKHKNRGALDGFRCRRVGKDNTVLGQKNRKIFIPLRIASALTTVFL